MKERLTGAIILVALIVLLVPELLTGPIGTRSAPAASSTGASQPAARASHAQPPLRSYTLTLSGAPPDQQAPAIPAAQGPPQTPAEGTPDSSAHTSTEAGAPEQAATAPQDPQSHAEASGLPRQSAGPGSGGLQGAKSPAHSVAQEARSSGSSGGWVVQLGSFASRQNADRLARSLRGRGFRMSVSSARAGARVLWRVRAGPVHDRAGAQRLAARLRALGRRGELLPVR